MFMLSGRRGISSRCGGSAVDVRGVAREVDTSARIGSGLFPGAGQSGEARGHQPRTMCRDNQRWLLCGGVHGWVGVHVHPEAQRRRGL